MKSDETGHRRPPVLPYRRGVLASSALLVAVVAGTGHPGEPAPRVERPGPAYRYADPVLPGHFRVDGVRRLDNTPATNPVTDAGASLGRALFYETRLSADGTLSCGSCHVQANAFAHPSRVSAGVGGRLGDRNAMGLANARFHASGRFFWDERAATLERQVLQPIANPKEMAHDVGKVVETLGRDPAYARLFGAAFGDPAVTPDRLAKALAQFVRSMVSTRSRFDDGLASAGSIARAFANFTPAENRGKAIFLGDHDRESRGNCASCHLRDYDFRGPRDDRARQSALFVSDRMMNNGLDAEPVGPDNGLGDLTLDPREYGRFKVPDLRNVELTAPYMHDGRLATLEAVVDHYDTGVKPHPNLEPQLRTRRGDPSPRLMRLKASDKAALVAFLKTLTDRDFVADPRFSDPSRR